MKAIVTKKPLPVSDPQSLVEIELAKPRAAGRDLLVRVLAISINPVDTKVRAGATNVDGLVLGWDAAGVVEEMGDAVTGFQVGDEVCYAGEITRPGSNAEFQLVDERLVAHKPKTLSFADSAAFPLVSITAWEALFARMNIAREGNEGRSILIIGGPGGVGSIAIQLAHLAGLTVVATASRAETAEWVRAMGAHFVVNHRESIPEQLKAIGVSQVDYIANFFDTDSYWQVMAEVIKPQGHIVSIVETSGPVDLGLLKAKSVTFSWEFMFTRSQFQTPDMGEQGRLLAQIAGLIDSGRLRPITGEILAEISAANLREAHRKAESGKLIGKLVLDGWSA